MTRMGYLNQRFLYGMNIKSSNFVGASPTQIHEGLNSMFETCPWTTRALPLVMDRWKDLFKGRFRPNWFVPLHLGGLGVKSEYSDKKSLNLTREQRLVAAQFVHNPGMSICREKKVSISTTKSYLKILGTPYLVPKTQPKTLEESFDELGKWVGRLSYCDRLAGKLVEPTDEMILLKFSKSWEKPLSDRGFQYYSECEWRTGAFPLCPSLNEFHFNRLI